MIIYHTSTLKVINPLVSMSRRYLDFGQGFYLTKLNKQAIQYGNRYKREGLPAIMNVYVLEDSLPDSITRKVFVAYDDEWLDYVSACRREEDHVVYDIVEGGIADDDVFNTLNLYWADLITRETALGQLIKKKPNHQICITNQQVIDQYLHFQQSQTL